MKVVTVDGKKVYFNGTELSSVQGDRLSFENGARCDLKTGIIHDGATPATIRIGSEIPQDITTVNIEYRSQDVFVEYIDAELVVGVHDRNDIHVHISGPQEEIQFIQPGIVGGRLKIGDTRGRSILESSNGITIRGFFGPKNVKIEDLPSGVTVRVMVPNKTNIAIKGVKGTTTVGDTHANFAIQECIGYVRVGDVESANLSASISTTILVQSVSRSLTVDAGTHANVSIDGGIAENVVIKASTSAHVKFGGFARGLKLTLGTHATAWLANVSGDLAVNCSTSADAFIAVANCTSIKAECSNSSKLVVKSGHITAIDGYLCTGTSGYIEIDEINGDVLKIGASTHGTVKIRKGEVASLDVNTSTSGKVSYGGVAVDAKLRASTSGEVNVAAVLNRPEVKESTSGRVRVLRVGE